MGKENNTLPPLDDSILRASDDKNDEVKPGLISVKSYERRTRYNVAPTKEWLFALRVKEPKASNEKSKEKRGHKMKK